ncbi:MAG: hypothetical protein ACTSQP_07235 [Promethearchaeota archaeon]
MNSQEFFNELQRASELMKNEKYLEAIKILDNLREIERQGDFDYSLTHKLYQLISNSHSLLNQQIILEILNNYNENQLSFKQLAEKLKDTKKLDLDEANVRKEVELLILRGKLNCRLDGDLIVLE